jgi:hypothetical protein
MYIFKIENYLNQYDIKKCIRIPLFMRPAGFEPVVSTLIQINSNILCSNSNGVFFEL